MEDTLGLDPSVGRRASSSLATGTNNTLSSNGRTMAFEVMNRGSMPCGVANTPVVIMVTSGVLVA